MSALDLTPQLAPGRQLIERYAATGFRVSGVVFRGPVLVFPERTVMWDIEAAAAPSLDSLAPVIEDGGVRLLLLGLGARGGMVSGDLRRALRAEGIAVEPMGTGPACRTFNVLLAEDRRVVAALLPA